MFQKCTLLYFLLLLSNQLLNALSYKPVIIMHGLFDKASSLEHLAENIKKAHPGTEVHSVNVFDDSESLQPMWKQLKSVQKITNKIMASSNDGVNIIGFSQGGLLIRGIIQTTNDHTVNNFIALSSPLNGQFGDTSYIAKYLPFLPSHLKEDMYEVFYSSLGQDWSIANYWKDPHQVKLYEKYSSYLAVLNNESSSETQAFQLSWKKNFARLKNLILIGGPDDGVITPWQSSQFACYDNNEKVVPFRSLQIYQNDVFGLKTLDKQKKIHECTVPGVEHTNWHKNDTVFFKCIEPWLT